MRHDRSSTSSRSTQASSDGPALVAPHDRIIVSGRGQELIGQSFLNKGTAFPESERDAFGLRGLLPASVTTITEQLELELEHVRRKPEDLERYIGLAALQDRNETLFYRLLLDNLEEFLPIVYTPTVASACESFSHILRRPRGAWITPSDIGRIDSILETAADGDVRLIVVTDNERILGLGDQGAGGMAIPVGKLTLYTAAAGIHPAHTLAVSLDVGTDNRELLDDPLYLGYRSPRLRGDAYDAILEAFVESVGRVFPRAVVQWEDFKQHNAIRVLGRYRHRLPSFNDDVQGTAAVVVAGLLAARRSLAGERILFLGAGAAAIGIARLVSVQLAAEGAASDQGAPAMVMFDHVGLVHLGRTTIAEAQRPFAADPAYFAARGLTELELADPVAVARVLRPTVLIGTTGGHGAFSEELVREIAGNARQPIILPLSNPGSRAEAQADQILDWTDGRALVATGSPSGVVKGPWGRRIIGQANNVFIFPGVGLGAILAEVREVPDDAFLVAAQELAGCVTPERLAAGALYPPIDQLRATARTVAIALVRHLRDAGYGRQFRDEEIEPVVDRAMWYPAYLPYEEE